MTSANVVEYRIEKNKKVVAYHRQHLMCSSNHHELLKFQPLNEYSIISFGYDEEENYWEDKPINLEKYLKKLTLVNKEIKNYFNGNNDNSRRN